jgi:hypothetical protein
LKQSVYGQDSAHATGNIALAGAIGRNVQIAAADEFAASMLPVLNAIRQGADGMPMADIAASMLPVLNAIRAAGADTLEAMSCALNQRGIRSARGGRWYASSVSMLLARTGTLRARLAFVKLKALLHKADERTRDDFWDRISLLLKDFLPEECANYLAQDGECSNNGSEPHIWFLTARTAAA